MEHGDDQIGVERLGGLHGLHDGVLVDLLVFAVIVLVEQIDAVFRALRHGDVVEPLGIGDEGDLDAVHILEQNAVIRLLVVLGGVGADVVDADGIEVFDGAFQSGNAVLDAVGVGGLDKIKALLLERQRQCLRRAEIRTAGIRLAAEVQLQIADRES